LTLENKGTYHDKLTIYIPKSKKPLIQEARRIMKREGSSLSKFLLEKIEQYYDLHEPGNPQQRIDTILKLGKAYYAPKPLCGFKNCLRDSIAIGFYVPHQEKYGLCEKHLAQVKNDSQNWKIKGGE
jgi:hypothetical protein